MVRPARLEDAPAIARVHVDSWRETYAGIVPQDFLDGLSYEQREQMWQRGLENPNWPGRLFVANDAKDGLVGFVAGGPPQEANSGFDCWLWAIYLLQKHQNKGLGKQLFQSFTREMHLLGHGSMMLWVLTENPTVGFYQRMGGQKVQQKELEIGGKKLLEEAYGWLSLEAI